MATIHHLDLNEVAAVGRYRDIIELELAQEIIDYGTEPGLRALHVVSRAGEVELARALIRKHANVDFCTAKGLSPLHYAVLSGKPAMIRLLLLYGARVNIRSSRDGKTPLFLAAEKGSMELVQLLLDNGGNPKICDHNDMMPSDIAACNRHTAVKRVLEERCRNLPTDISRAPVFALMNHRRQSPTAPSPTSPLSSMTLSPSQLLPLQSTFSAFSAPSSETYGEPPPTYEEVMSAESLFGTTAYSQSPEDSDTAALLGDN